MDPEKKVHIAGNLHIFWTKSLSQLDNCCCTSWLLPQTCRDYLSLNRKVFKIYEKTKHQLDGLFEKKNAGLLRWDITFALWASAASKNEAWCCDYIAAYVYTFLYAAYHDAPSHPRVERISSGIKAKGQAHAFIIVNRDPTTPVRKLSQWNDDAWVLDPWSGFCLSVAEIKKMGKDFHTQHVMYRYLSQKAKVIHLLKCDELRFLPEKNTPKRIFDFVGTLEDRARQLSHSPPRRFTT